MAALIFDASGIVKRCVNEAGSAWVQVQADPATGDQIFLTRITRIEVTAAVTRRGKSAPALDAAAAAVLIQFRSDIAREYNVLEIMPAVLGEAERLAELHGLRGYDAVQLAASIELDRARVVAGLSTLS